MSRLKLYLYKVIGSKRSFVKNHVLYIFLWVFAGILASCSDSEVVAGTFHGKMYSTDTVEANVKVTSINDGIIRMDITGPAFNGGYVEYAQLRRDADNAFALTWNSNGTFSDTLELSGYYFEGYLSYDSWTHQYKFGGQKE